MTLVVPGFNDSDDELRALAGFLAGISPDIPWHVIAFHRDYRMLDPHDTSPVGLQRAAAIGRDAGLRYVYAGNLPGAVGNLEDTFCPKCGKLLIQRFGSRTLEYEITPGGCCPKCGETIPGYWMDPLHRPLAHRPDLAWVPRYCG